MVMRHHVDVVTGPSTPTSAAMSVPADSPEAVDVAPDAGRRIVIVARTKALGAELAEARKIEPIAIATPRSPHVHVTADDIVWADDLTHEERASLEPHVLPVTATSRAEDDDR